MKVVKEDEEKVVRLVIEMNDTMENLLLEYADSEMNEAERKELFINWAFNKIVEKHCLEKEQAPNCPPSCRFRTKLVKDSYCRYHHDLIEGRYGKFQ